MVCVPGVFSVIPTIRCPPVRVELFGKTAAGSLEVKPTVVFVCVT